MDASRFDRFTRSFALRGTRRATLAAGIGTLAAAVGMPSARASQDAPSTPVASPAAGAEPTFLYVQTFSGGTLASIEGQPDRFLLSLTDAPASTVVFADHPARETNLLPTERLPEVLSFAPANPPNAALVARAESGEEFVLVIELLEPMYDPDTRTVTYQVIELADYRMVGSEFAERAQPIATMPASFGSTSLFIDSGGDGSCRDSLAVCSSDSQCCANFLCIPTTCTPDDPSRTSTVSTDLGMCMPPIA